jgi:hypothetical protein
MFSKLEFKDGIIYLLKRYPMKNENQNGSETELKKIVFKSSRPEVIFNEILDKFAVMEILCISERTLKNHIKHGVLPCSLIGNKYFFLYSDLLAMIERFKVKKGR